MLIGHGKNSVGKKQNKESLLDGMRFVNLETMERHYQYILQYKI